MKHEELPENMQKQIDELKHYAQTIQSDVMDALETAESLEEFLSQVGSSMDEIISEAQKVLEVLGTGKGVSFMVKKDLPPILKGSGEKPTIHCPHCFTDQPR